MVHASSPSRPPFRPGRLSFASLYTIWAMLPTALLVWVAQASLHPAITLAQTIAPQTPPTTRDLLEQARDRLIDRGELPDASEYGLTNEAGDGEDSHHPGEFNTYRLGPGDSIFVNVLRFADLSFQGTIDLEGNLLVPLVGALPLEGMTVTEAREQIRVALDRYVINPQVDVILIAQRSVQVSVLGEVVKPGLYPLASPQLAAALMSAGGTTSLADLRTIRIRRTQPDGSVREQDFDLYTPLLNALPMPDIQLADGDIVVIPTLTAENRESYDRSLIARSTLAQQQINIRVVNYTAGTGGAIGNLPLPNGSSFVDALTAISPNLASADLHSVALIRFDVDQGKAVSQKL
ncbi:MAG TPA: polysaccharide biosynthesis/export family protein, partial [Allocoleopsis sp.]